MEMSFRSSQDKQNFLNECKSNCAGDTSYLKYLGCFVDEDDRDLPRYIGWNMKIEDCFASGKKAGYKYVGLQNGGECWGSKDRFGSKGRAPEADCSMYCRKNADYKCGNANRNSIYELKDYKIPLKAVDCTDVPVKDCSKTGGYDPLDKCKATCVHDNRKEKCMEGCFNQMALVPAEHYDE